MISSTTFLRQQVLLAASWLLLLLLHPTFSIDVSCPVAESFANEFLNFLIEGCINVDRSQCGLASQCGLEGCQEDVDSSTTSCLDGCSYTLGNYEVSRVATAGLTRVYFQNNNGGNTELSVNFLGYRNTFLQGAEGTIDYSFEMGVGTLTPAIGGTCHVFFNGQQCFCEQRFCDASQTTVGNYIDCSGVEGGGVIDSCQVVLTNTLPELTEESSLQDILFWLPMVSCQTPPASDTGTQGSTATAEAEAAASATGVTAAGDDVGDDVASSGTSASTKELRCSSHLLASLILIGSLSL